MDGIISTKAQLIRCAKEQGLVTVQRVFVLDSKGMDSIEVPVEIGDPILSNIFGTDIIATRQIL